MHLLYQIFHLSVANEKEFICAACDRKKILQESNFFVYIPLLQQILYIIEENIDYIVKTKSANELMSDVHDGEILTEAKAKLSNENEILCPLTLNTDGIQLFGNSKLSVWLLQLYQNYIPPNRRYIPENIIVVGVFYGHLCDLNMADFLRPLSEELNLLKDAFLIEKDSVKYKCFPIISSCTVDLPAECKKQGFK